MPSGQGNRKWIFVIVGFIILLLFVIWRYSAIVRKFGNRLHNMTEIQEPTKKTLSEIEMETKTRFPMFTSGLDIFIEVKADTINQIDDMNSDSILV